MTTVLWKALPIVAWRSAIIICVHVCARSIRSGSAVSPFDSFLCSATTTCDSSSCINRSVERNNVFGSVHVFLLAVKSCLRCLHQYPLFLVRLWRGPHRWSRGRHHRNERIVVLVGSLSSSTTLEWDIRDRDSKKERRCCWIQTLPPGIAGAVFWWGLRSWYKAWFWRMIRFA